MTDRVNNIKFTCIDYDYLCANTHVHPNELQRIKSLPSQRHKAGSAMSPGDMDSSTHVPGRAGLVSHNATVKSHLRRRYTGCLTSAGLISSRFQEFAGDILIKIQ